MMEAYFKYKAITPEPDLLLKKKFEFPPPLLSFPPTLSHEMSPPVTNHSNLQNEEIVQTSNPAKKPLLEISISSHNQLYLFPAENSNSDQIIESVIQQLKLSGSKSDELERDNLKLSAQRLGQLLEFHPVAMTLAAATILSDFPPNCNSPPDVVFSIEKYSKQFEEYHFSSTDPLQRALHQILVKLQSKEDEESLLSLSILSLISYLPPQSLSVELIHFIHHNLKLADKTWTDFTSKVRHSPTRKGCRILGKFHLISITEEEEWLQPKSFRSGWAVRIHPEIQKGMREILNCRMEFNGLIQLTNFVCEHNYIFENFIPQLQIYLRESGWSGQTYGHALFLAFKRENLEEGNRIMQEVYRFLVGNEDGVEVEDEEYFNLCRILMVKRITLSRDGNEENFVIDNSKIFESKDLLCKIKGEIFFDWVMDQGFLYKENMLMQKMVVECVDTLIESGLEEKLNDERRTRLTQWLRQCHNLYAKCQAVKWFRDLTPHDLGLKPVKLVRTRFFTLTYRHEYLGFFELVLKISKLFLPVEKWSLLAFSLVTEYRYSK